MVRCESDGSKISAFAGGVHSWGPATPGTQRSTDTRYGLPTYGPDMSLLRRRVRATFIPLGRTRGAQAPMETTAFAALGPIRVSRESSSQSRRLFFLLL